jgi:hypothetical protein
MMLDCIYYIYIITSAEPVLVTAIKSMVSSAKAPAEQKRVRPLFRNVSCPMYVPSLSWQIFVDK